MKGVFVSPRIQGKVIFTMHEQVHLPYEQAIFLETHSVSASYLRREFKKFTGSSPAQYHNALRVDRVKYLLRNTTLSIKEIAENLSFDSPFHLSLNFKKKTGQSPKQWRKEKLLGDSD